MFSAELRERRYKARMSLREAAREMDGALSFSMLNRYERGIGLGVMNINHARAISKLFRWSIAEILRKIEEEVSAKV